MSAPLKFTLTALPAAAADGNGEGPRRISHMWKIGGMNLGQIFSITLFLN